MKIKCAECKREIDLDNIANSCLVGFKIDGEYVCTDCACKFYEFTENKEIKRNTKAVKTYEKQ